MFDVGTHAVVSDFADFAHEAVLAEGGFEAEEGAFVGGAVAEDEVDFFVRAGCGEGEVVALVVIFRGARRVGFHE